MLFLLLQLCVWRSCSWWSVLCVVIFNRSFACFYWCCWCHLQFRDCQGSHQRPHNRRDIRSGKDWWAGTKSCCSELCDEGIAAWRGLRPRAGCAKCTPKSGLETGGLWWVLATAGWSFSCYRKKSCSKFWFATPPTISCRPFQQTMAGKLLNDFSTDVSSTETCPLFSP